MGSNAFLSLQSLLGAFSTVSVPICRFSSTDEISKHLASIDKARTLLLGELSSTNVEFEALKSSLGVCPTNFFIDCGAVIAVASGLQCALSEYMQGKIGSRVGREADRSQEETHLLVDLWGQVEASKALFEFTVRHSQVFVSSAGNQSITVDSLKAQYKVMLSALEELIVTLGVRFGERVSMSDAGAVVDWSLCLLRSAGFVSLRDAVNHELYELSA